MEVCGETPLQLDLAVMPPEAAPHPFNRLSQLQETLPSREIQVSVSTSHINLGSCVNVHTHVCCTVKQPVTWGDHSWKVCVRVRGTVGRTERHRWQMGGLLSALALVPVG